VFYFSIPPALINQPGLKENSLFLILSLEKLQITKGSYIYFKTPWLGSDEKRILF